MTREEFVEDRPAHPALRRILAENGELDLVDVLADRLSNTDLTTVLLEVFRRRARRRTAAQVLRRYQTDRFVAPSTTGFAALRRAEDALLSALPKGFEVLVLAPLVPLATHSAVSTVDPRKVVTTIRGTEVAADPANGLALEASARRLRILASPRPHPTEPVRLAASQRVVRAQRFEGPGMSAHFQLFALVTAGRETGDRSFARQHVAEHLRFAARGLTAAGAQRVQFRVTGLRGSAAEIVRQLRKDLADLRGIDVVEDPDRTTGRGYYTDLCFKIYMTVAGEWFEVGDGGFVDWSRQFVGSRKEHLLTSGIGVDRLADAVTGAKPADKAVTAAEPQDKVDKVDKTVRPPASRPGPRRFRVLPRRAGR
jgi:hypothetical protein